MFSEDPIEEFKSIATEAVAVGNDESADRV
jgi:hypothetical protein